MDHPVRSNYTATVLIILFWGIYYNVYTQEYRFSHLTIDDGLLDNTVYEILEDRNGLIWIASARGLQQYDGHQFKNFVYNEAKKDSFVSGFIRSLAEDNQGNLWVGSQNGGLARYSNGKFTIYQHHADSNTISHNFIETIVADSDGSLWIGTWGGGLNHFSNGSFTYYQHDDNNPNSLFNDNVVAVTPDDKEGVWIGMWHGGLDYLNNGKIAHYSFDSLGIKEGYSARCLLTASDGTIWVGLWGDGLVQLENGRVKQYFNHDINNPRGLSNNNLLALSEGQDGTIWASTFGGGTHEIINGKVNRISQIPGDPASISSNRIECSFVDSKDNIWFGSYGGGVSKMTNKGFKAYRYVQLGNKRVLLNGVSAIAGDNNGTIFAGTTSGRLGYLKNGAYYEILDGSSPKINLHLQDIRSILYYPEKLMIAGLTDYLYEYKKGRLKKIESSKNYISRGQYQLFLDNEGNLVASTFENGLVHFDGQVPTKYSVDSDSSQNIHSSDAHCGLSDQQGRLWVGTHEAGVSVIENGKVIKQFLYDPASKHSIADNHIKSMFMSQNGDVWIGTWGGALNRFNPSLDGFDIYINSEGSKSDIQAIQEDELGNLWLATAHGLSHFNTSDQVFSNYDIKDGVDARPFLANSSYRDESTGLIYFGGENGITVFDPKEIRTDAIPPKLMLTGFKVLNEPYSFDHSTKSILNYKQNLLSFDFVAPNTRAKYQFRLNGFDKDWSQLSNRRFANYTNLPPGEYTFEASAINDFGVASDAPLLFPFVIKPPFWQMWWFRISAILLVVALLAVTYWIRISSLKRKQVYLKSKVAERTKELVLSNNELADTNKALRSTIQNLHETQQKLIQSEKMASLGILSAGIGHEINNPLNFIKNGIINIEKVIKKTGDIPDNLHPLIEIVNEGVSRASRIVKSLSYFSRTTDKLDEECDLQDIIDNCLVILNSELKHRVKIEKCYAQSPVVVKGNIGKLHQAIMNVLSNSNQAIDDEGTIKIKTSTNGNHVAVEVLDDGSGIPKDYLAKISDPFFTTKAPGQGTGLGLSITYSIIKEHGGEVQVTSEINKGTNFKIILPISYAN